MHAIAPALEIHDLTGRVSQEACALGHRSRGSARQAHRHRRPERRRQIHADQSRHGLVPISSGWVKVFGEPLKKSLPRIGYVPQRESVDWDFPSASWTSC
jgi:manganese/zinc/iron transport system ATP- binding protein